MNYLLKINRGVVVTALVLIAVITYLVTLTVIQNAEKPKIEDIVTKYIQTEISYRMLPKNYRVDNPKMPKIEQDEYIVDMISNIQPYYPDNSLSYKYIIENLKTSIENQAKGSQMIFDYKKDIVSFSDYRFDNDNVTVTVKSNSSFDGFNYQSPNSAREKASQTTSDIITLQKINEEWKVVHAVIVIPQNYEGDMYRTEVKYR